MTLRVLLPLALILAGACTKNEPVAESAACCTNDTPNQGAHAAGHDHDHAHEGHTAGAAEKGAALSSIAAVKVTGTVGASGVAISVQNHGTQPVKLASRLSVFRGDQRMGVVVPGEAPALRWSCDAPPDACVTLAPGAELIPPAWPARKGRGACGECPQCEDVEPGSYYFVVSNCEQNAEVHGDPFVIETLVAGQ